MSNKFSIFNFQFSKSAKAIFVLSAMVFLAVGCNKPTENLPAFDANQEVTPQQPQQEDKENWGVALENQTSDLNGITVTQTVEGSNLNKPSYEIKEGTTALELLKSTHTVETKEFVGIGAYVTSVNGNKETTGKNFWALYVNGKQSQVGASEYIVKNGDKIEWKLEEIK
jgi:hypothetical protein